jgi:glucose-6-phosphate 1-dehydrogenase
MSIPPAAYDPIIKNLALVGLSDDQNRILLEKPFGYDLKSAEDAIKIVGQAFKEKQIYRIDHYLAKETAQNLLAFRLHNPIFMPLWSSQHIDFIHVRQFETIGIEGRANFYEQTGALRDMIQSHLMQLLALTLMDTPEDMTSEAIHVSKQNFFSELNLAEPKDVIRGQYKGYKEEVDNPNSSTETYVKLHLTSQAEMWRETEIILEHGKAMSETAADITIAFKTPHERRRNSLTFQIQPNEGISLDLVVKEPGFENNMKHTALDFRYRSAFKDVPYVDAYERVLMDAIQGDQSLFASDEEVLTTWKVLQPILDNWANNSDGLVIYPVGSEGL